MKPRNRIMLELMARGGMRVGEVLKIRPMDIQDRKLTLAGPKSGKESEVVFIPQKVADRLKEYVKESGAGPELSRRNRKKPAHGLLPEPGRLAIHDRKVPPHLLRNPDSPRIPQLLLQPSAHPHNNPHPRLRRHLPGRPILAAFSPYFDKLVSNCLDLITLSFSGHPSAAP
jgi:hypothetical protein